MSRSCGVRKPDLGGLEELSIRPSAKVACPSSSRGGHCCSCRSFISRCARSSSSSDLHLAGTVDDVRRDLAAGEAAMVNPVEVVEAQVGVELALEATQARLHVAGEGGSPALVEDRLVQGLDIDVGLRAAGVDTGV